MYAEDSPTDRTRSGVEPGVCRPGVGEEAVEQDATGHVDGDCMPVWERYEFSSRCNGVRGVGGDRGAAYLLHQVARDHLIAGEPRASPS